MLQVGPSDGRGLRERIAGLAVDCSDPAVWDAGQVVDLEVEAEFSCPHC